MIVDEKIYQHPKLITIFGGTGFIGTHLTEYLAKLGFRLRLAVRYPEKAYAIKQIGAIGQIDMVRTNVCNEKQVKQALAGADVAIYLAGTFQNKSNNTFSAVHILGAENVAKLSRNYDIPLIHFSALFPEEIKNSAFYKTKQQGEDAVKEVYPRATIIKPSLVYGPNDHFFNQQAKWAMFPGAFPLLGAGKAKWQPLYICHLAQFIASLIKKEIPLEQSYELGGEEIFTYKELVEILLTAIARPKKIRNIPSPIAYIFGSIFNIIDKFPLIKVPFTLEQVRLMQHDCLVSQKAYEENRTLCAINTTPSSLKSTLSSYLWYRRPQGQFTPETMPDWSR